MAEHGTNARYQIHRRRGEDACEDCREAARVYQAQHRASHPERRKREAANVAARARAARRLAARYPEEFRALFEQEKRRNGHEGS